MKFISRNAAITLLAVVVIASIIDATNAKPPARIVEGENAKPGEFKFMVSFSRGYRTNLCGGAIIGSRYILTAAHCLDGLKARDLTVRTGIVDLRESDLSENRIARLIMHPDYQSPIPHVRKIKNDIGIVVMDKNFTLGERVSAIRLPTKPLGKQKASFCGWGDIRERPTIEPMILQKTEVEVINDDECWRMGLFPYSPQFFCAYQKHGNILDGDSGSPLTSDGEIIGVASSGFGIKGLADYYTNVYYYRDWIKSIIDEPLD